MLEFKCWYYDKAIADGNEDGINAMLPDKLPKEIQKLYNKAHMKKPIKRLFPYSYSICSHTG